MTTILLIFFGMIANYALAFLVLTLLLPVGARDPIMDWLMDAPHGFVLFWFPFVVSQFWPIILGGVWYIHLCTDGEWQEYTGTHRGSE